MFLTEKAAEKLAGFPDPHARVSGYIADAAAKSYEDLLAGHLADYTGLFDRVSLDLGAAEPDIPTDELVDAYPDGASSRYLEELAFQFGRYMLICSSRAGTLPAPPPGNLERLQRSHRGHLSTCTTRTCRWPTRRSFQPTLSELFESYMEYFKAFVPRQRLYATQYVGAVQSLESRPERRQRLVRTLLELILTGFQAGQSLPPSAQVPGSP